MTLKDRYGKPHKFRALSLAELIELEKRLGGAFQVCGDKMSYADALFCLASALDMKEADVLPLFDGPSAAVALGAVMAANLPKKIPNIRVGSKDDIDD
jgi:hypothetical protein